VAISSFFDTLSVSVRLARGWVLLPKGLRPHKTLVYMTLAGTGYDAYARTCIGSVPSRRTEGAVGRAADRQLGNARGMADRGGATREPRPPLLRRPGLRRVPAIRAAGAGMGPAVPHAGAVVSPSSFPQAAPGGGIPRARIASSCRGGMPLIRLFREMRETPATAGMHRDIRP
jgi:hypothetical protein